MSKKEMIAVFCDSPLVWEHWMYLHPIPPRSIDRKKVEFHLDQAVYFRVFDRSQLEGRVLTGVLVLKGPVDRELLGIAMSRVR